jgi:uncharacterized protein (DUF4415 family)
MSSTKTGNKVGVRPPKEQAKQERTLRLDADIVGWLKEQATGYQTRIDSILREVMKHRRALPGG